LLKGPAIATGIRGDPVMRRKYFGGDTKFTANGADDRGFLRNGVAMGESGYDLVDDAR
jgi:hypothetical protein